MEILLTGASGYIGSHLLPHLLEKGHRVYALMRHDPGLKLLPEWKPRLTLLHGDLLNPSTLPPLPHLDSAYYLVHSMSDDPKHFSELETQACLNFLSIIQETGLRQIIYLSGLHQGTSLSEHFKSRLHIEEIFKKSPFPVTVLRASIIIGKESASFRIIRDLVERLPLMIAPRWLNTRCQPIAITDVLYYLAALLGQPQAMHQTFEIGGPDVMTFKEMLLKYAQIRGLKRWIRTVSLLTPRLSSYWLYLITQVNFSLASSLVESLKVESVVRDAKIQDLFPHECLSYSEAIKQAIR